MKITNWIRKNVDKVRRAVSGASVAVTMVGLSIALYIGAVILPSALLGWYSATQANGTLENMSDNFILLWNLTPIAVVLVVVIAVVAMALRELSAIHG